MGKTANISRIGVAELLAHCAASVGLRCHAGPQGDDAGLLLRQGELPEIGRYNPRHANDIVLLGGSELHYLDDPGHRLGLLATPPTLLILIDGGVPPAWLLDAANERAVALWSTPLSAGRLRGYLYPQLLALATPRCEIHAVLLDVAGVGTLLLGPAGAGKGSLALALLGRGHRLIADDCVRLRRNGDDELRGSSPGPLSGYLFVRGLGVIDVAREFGVMALGADVGVRQWVGLRPDEGPSCSDSGQAELGGEQLQRDWLGVSLSGLLLRGQNGAADRVEAYTRRWLLATRGLRVAEQFACRQQALLKSGREE